MANTEMSYEEKKAKMAASSREVFGTMLDEIEELARNFEKITSNIIEKEICGRSEEDEGAQKASMDLLMASISLVPEISTFAGRIFSMCAILKSCQTVGGTDSSKDPDIRAALKKMTIDNYISFIRHTAYESAHTPKSPGTEA